MCGTWQANESRGLDHLLMYVLDTILILSLMHLKSSHLRMSRVLDQISDDQSYPL